MREYRYASQAAVWLFVFVAGLACRNQTGQNQNKSKDVRGGSPPATISVLDVRDSAGLLFSFFDHRAVLTTVDRIADVEEIARTEVMVTDPRQQLPGDLVHVADLRQKTKGGHYRSWVELRSSWLDRNMPKTSISEAIAAKSTTAGQPAAGQPAARQPAAGQPATGQLATKQPAAAHSVGARPAAVQPVAGSAKPVEQLAQAQPAPAKQRSRRGAYMKRGRSSGDKAAAKAGGVRVFLFSTAWCPSCRAAHQYFTEKGIPFREFDVEKDQAAQQQFVAIQQQYGMKVGAVPLIIVNGRLIQGFVVPQIEAALAAGPPPAQAAPPPVQASEGVSGLRQMAGAGL